MVRIIPAMNRGAAFGMGSGFGAVFVVLALVAVGVMIYVVVKHGPHSRLLPFALGLLTGGALGNVYDRLFFDGRVRDFIDWTIFGWRYPAIFNVADIAICIGCALVVIHSFFGPVKRDACTASRHGTSPDGVRDEKERA
jgi:signal peptidase II